MFTCVKLENGHLLLQYSMGRLFRSLSLRCGEDPGFGDGGELRACQSFLVVLCVIGVTVFTGFKFQVYGPRVTVLVTVSYVLHSTSIFEHVKSTQEC
jgi:hypothetical protein